MRQVCRDARHLRQLFRCGFQDAFDRPKAAQQRLAPCRTDAGHLVQPRSQPQPGALVAVRGDRKAVRFVADALDQVQRLRLARQHQRVGLPGQEQLLILLRQPCQRDFPTQLEFLQHLHRPAQLAFAAIHDQEIRQ